MDKTEVVARKTEYLSWRRCKQNRVVERMQLCSDWLDSIERLKGAKQKDAIFEFIEVVGASEEDFANEDQELHEIAYNKVRKQLRTKYAANEPLNLKCEWSDCEFKTRVYNEFRSHVRRHAEELSLGEKQNSREVLKCPWRECRFATEDTSEAIRHVLFHSYHTKLKSVGENVHRRYSMAECKRSRAEINLLPDLPSDHVCRWIDCGMLIGDVQDFLDHVQGHALGADVVGDGRLACGWLGCAQRFPNLNKLKFHLVRHTAEKKVACPRCGRTFATNSVFEDHCNRQADVLAHYTCDTCRKSFASERLLRAHARRHINSFKCSFCDMTLNSPSGLIKHIRYRHLDYRPFRCHHCPYSAVSKSDIKRHIQRHEGFAKRRTIDADEEEARIYACHCCDDCFSTGSHLSQHLIKAHGFIKGSGFQRFRYELSEDGYYRLIPVRYESVELSDQIGAEKELSSDFKDSHDFKVVQTTEGDCGSLASFVLVSGNRKPREVEPRIVDLHVYHRPADESASSDQSKKSKQEVRGKRKAQKLPEDREPNKKRRTNVPNRRKLDAPSAASTKTNNIQIAIADVDRDGNVIRSEVIESEEIIIGV